MTQYLSFISLAAWKRMVRKEEMEENREGEKEGGEGKDQEEIELQAPLLHYQN